MEFGRSGFWRISGTVQEGPLVEMRAVRLFVILGAFHPNIAETVYGEHGKVGRE
jgi:hypothetical protein